MSTIRKTITVTAPQSEWIKSRIASGDFTNDSEYIRDLIRRDQERLDEVERVRRALAEGERSGLSEKSFDDILNAARDKVAIHENAAVYQSGRE
ncbi:type II toxin-antitoxin system ParD family antitoxin [uncultured Thalassolituus sp.]|jgi:antitoxin ParD1/3/4|uniref:type II toxin-antitoxin system ParD family antitoxin n=1 Tax=Thalassolituus sp. TaxID=2030822 RepID=UPI00262E291A|nr:type II toxin-antitoxin system ParD family antitoxin [uncultured Thalassolituus sp.]